MPENEQPWLQIIGKALAYLCVQQASKEDPVRFKELLPKVEFLQSIGLSQADAAELLGSSKNSVQVLTSRKKKVGGRAAKSKR